MINRIKITVEIDVYTLLAIDKISKAVYITRDDFINSALKGRIRDLGDKENG